MSLYLFIFLRDNWNGVEGNAEKMLGKYLYIARHKQNKIKQKKAKKSRKNTMKRKEKKRRSLRTHKRKGTIQ